MTNVMDITFNNMFLNTIKSQKQHIIVMNFIDKYY